MSITNTEDNIQAAEKNGQDNAEKQLAELKYSNKLLLDQTVAFSNITVALQQILSEIKPLSDRQQAMRIANTATATNTQYKDVSTYVQFADRHGVSQEEALDSFKNVKKDLFDVRGDKQKLEQNPMIKALAAQNKELYEQLKNADNMSDFAAIITENLSKAKKDKNKDAMKAAFDYFKSEGMVASYSDSMIRRPTQAQLEQAGNSTGQAELRENPFYNMQQRAESQQAAYDKTVGDIQNRGSEVRQRNASDQMVAQSVYQITREDKDNQQEIADYNKSPMDAFLNAYKEIVKNQFNKDPTIKELNEFTKNVGKLFDQGEATEGAVNISNMLANALMSTVVANKDKNNAMGVVESTSNLTPEEEGILVQKVTAQINKKTNQDLIKSMKNVFGVQVTRNGLGTGFVGTREDGSSFDIGSDLNLFFTENMKKALTPRAAINRKIIEQMTGGMKFDVGYHPGFGPGGWEMGPAVVDQDGKLNYLGWDRALNTPQGRSIGWDGDWVFENKIKELKDKKQQQENDRKQQQQNVVYRRQQDEAIASWDMPPYIGLGSNKGGGALRSFYSLPSMTIPSLATSISAQKNNGALNIWDEIKQSTAKIGDALQFMKQFIAQDKAVHNNQRVTVNLYGMEVPAMKGWLEKNIPSLMNGEKLGAVGMSKTSINMTKAQH